MKKILLLSLLCVMPLIAMDSYSGESPKKSTTIIAFGTVGYKTCHYINPDATDGEIYFIALLFGKEGEIQKLADEFKHLRNHNKTKQRKMNTCDRWLFTGLFTAVPLAFVWLGFNSAS